jgi:hypothetical protein
MLTEKFMVYQHGGPDQYASNMYDIRTAYVPTQSRTYLFRKGGTDWLNKIG